MSARGVPPLLAGLKSEHVAPRRDQALALCVIGAIVWCYCWTATSNSPEHPPWFGDQPGSYYAGLVDGFKHGHLYLDLPVDPRLVQAPDPYLPALRALVPHDLSYFRGHYYIYYGVAPVVALELPWRLITGRHLPPATAVVIFVTIGFLSATALWLSVRRRYFPHSGPIALGAGIAVLGLASATQALLRRPDLWEEPIAAGYGFAMAALFCLYRALQGQRTSTWLAAAGVALGLAVGSRPSYFAGAAAFVPVLAWLWRREGVAGDRWRWPNGRWWRATLALGGPFSAILAGLAWYNFARFGNPFEFGQTYQSSYVFGDEKPQLFNLSFGAFNAFVYYLAPPQWSRYFPFIKMIHVPAGPHNLEYVYGLLPHFPFVGLALAAPLALRRRAPAERKTLVAFLGSLAMFYLLVGGLLLCFRGAAARYMADFTPALMLLAGIGLLGAERSTAGWARRVLVSLAAAAAAFSVFVSAMLSFQLHDLLRQSNPQAYRRLVHFFDTPVSVLERLAGTRHGPLELTVRFPRGVPGAVEPLVTTGWEYESDYLFVRYLDGDRLQFGFEHSNRPVSWSPAVAIDRTRVHQLEVQMGSLFPPPGDPFYDQMSRFSAAGFARWLRVALDGQVLFDRPQDFYDSSPENVVLGESRLAAADFGRRFSGEMVAVRTGAIIFAPPFQPGDGTYELTLVLPESFPLALPLVAAGRAGRADILLVRQVGPGRVRFGYDHWGIGAWESGDVVMASGVRHVLGVALPGLAPPGTPRPQLALELDGRPAWNRRVPFYPVGPAEVRVGENGIGASTCAAEFSGVILDVTRR